MTATSARDQVLAQVLAHPLESARTIATFADKQRDHTLRVLMAADAERLVTRSRLTPHDPWLWSLTDAGRQSLGLVVVGPIDHSGCVPARWSHRTHNHQGVAGAWLFGSETAG